VLLVAVLAIGLFSFISSSAYRSGWSQGYVSGQEAGSEGGGNVTGIPFNHGGFHSPFSFFWWGLAACLKFWFFLFFIGLIFKFLFWGRRGGHYHGHHHGRPFGHWKGGSWSGWHGRHGDGPPHKGFDFKGQRPPWYDDDNGEPIMKA
jgi:hypothetical protein